mgnify:CR=1 FL=1
MIDTIPAINCIYAFATIQTIIIIAAVDFIIPGISVDNIIAATTLNNIIPCEAYIIVRDLVAANEVEVPASLIDQEIDRLRQQAVQQFGGGQQLDPNQLPAELFKDQAEKRVVIGLLMNAAIEANELTPSAEKVEQLIEEVAATYQDPDEVRNYYANNPQQKSQVEALALEEQVVEKVLAAAKVSQSESSYEEVIREANQPA